MRLVAILAVNDIRLFLRDKSGYVWLFGMPLVFIYFFGIAMRGGGGQPSSPRPVVLIENHDRGFIGRLFTEELGTQGLRLVEPGSEDKANHGIRIPDDFTERIINHQRSPITFFRREGSEAQAAAMVEMRMVRAIVGLSSGLFAAAARDPSTEIHEEALRGMLGREDAVRLDVRFAGRRPVPSGFYQSVPGYTVMFILMNLLMYGGITIAVERSNGVLRRIATHPVRKWHVILGKVSGRFVLGLVQIGFFILAGRFLFQVHYGDHLALVGLTLATFGWGCAALGVLVGALISSAEKVQGVCMLVSLSMAALGGCWWPLEIVPDTARTIGQLFPTAWALNALHQLISFGGGWTQIQHELWLLAGFAAVTTALAAKFLRYTA